MGQKAPFLSHRALSLCGQLSAADRRPLRRPGAIRGERCPSVTNFVRELLLEFWRDFDQIWRKATSVPHKSTRGLEILKNYLFS